jgi:hypothetical protein
MTSSNFTQVLKLLTYIRKVPGSNLDRDTDYRDWCFSWFYSCTVLWNRPQPFSPQSFQYLIFVFYRMTPSPGRTLQSRTLRWFVNDELERISKETISTYWMCYLIIWLEWLKEIAKNLRIFGVPAEIRTEHIPNTSLQRSHCNNPLASSTLNVSNITSNIYVPLPCL